MHTSMQASDALLADTYLQCTVDVIVHIMSESVHPKNLVNTISQKPMKGISPNFRDRYM